MPFMTHIAFQCSAVLLNKYYRIYYLRNFNQNAFYVTMKFNTRCEKLMNWSTNTRFRRKSFDYIENYAAGVRYYKEKRFFYEHLLWPNFIFEGWNFFQPSFGCIFSLLELLLIPCSTMRLPVCTFSSADFIFTQLGRVQWSH